VSSLTFVVLWTAALGANDSENYADAHEQAVKKGQPIVVMVSTEWCGPCQVMKKTIIPQVRQHGLLRRVAFAIVNPDHDRDLAMQLTGGGPVPQLVMYRMTSEGGWLRRKLIGGQTVEAVEEFINQGIAKDEAKTPDKSTEGAAKKGPPAGAPHAAVPKEQAPASPADGATPTVTVSHSGGSR
jgi:thioredoxin-like negative regulator of GroEL